MTHSAPEASHPISAGDLPSFSDSPRLRLFLGTILYLAQGMPQGVMFYGIASWLAANGQSTAAVGSVFAAVSMPWAFKFFLGAIQDRYTFLPMGRRRIWLVGAQVGIIASMIMFGLLAPAPDEMQLIIAFAFTMSIFTATQDVALDAMVIDLTPEHELGKVNGFMFGGKVLGISIGTAATGYLTEHYGLPEALFVMATAFAVPAFFAMIIRERSGERLLPWSKGTASPINLALIAPAWLPILKTALKSMVRRDPMIVAFLSLTHGIHQGILDTSLPVMSNRLLDWGEAKFTGLAGMTNLILAPLALLAGGQIIDRLGPRIVVVLASLATTSAVVSYAALQSTWSNELAFYAVYLGYRTPVLLAYLAMLVLTMRACDPVVPATTFTLMTSAFALGMSVGSANVGSIEAWGGFSAVLLFGGAMIALSGLSALFLSRKVGGANKEPPVPDDLGRPVI
ncbi:MAG: MFS transporter [Erythrobacter sp.]